MVTVFLDRDGVINQNRREHVKSWTEFCFIPGSLEALRLLTKHHMRVFVITNQAIVNRGVVNHAVVDDIHRRMVQVARANGALISGLRYCPHRDDEGCSCRKPRPGMLLELAKEWDINLTRSYMIGDAMSDIAAGAAVGCRTGLVLTGRGTEQIGRPEAREHRPTFVANNLFEAVQWVLSREGARAPDVVGQPLLAWAQA